MSSTLTVDSGFVRVPRAYIDLPVSPGAKSLLLHLCGAANDRGESWHAYADIAESLGRSKASIAAYVRELVELDLIEAIEQRTANGFNYRRRLKLVHWTAFLELWKTFSSQKKSIDPKEKRVVTEAKREEFSVAPVASGPDHSEGKSEASVPAEAQAVVTENTERRVQSAERKDPSGPINKIHQNKTPHQDPAVEAGPVWSEADEIAWKRFRASDSDPIGVVRGVASPEIVEKLKTIEAHLRQEYGVLEPAQAKALARSSFEDFIRTNRLDSTEDALTEASEALANLADSAPSIKACMDALQAIWKPYWRKIPTAKQVSDTLKDIAAQEGPSAEVRRKISKIHMRVWVAGFHASRQSSQQSPGSR